MKKHTTGNRITRYLLAACLLAIIAGVSGCERELGGSGVSKNALRIRFANKAGNTNLSLGVSFTNPFGEAVTFTNFKYYITNIKLVTASGTETAIENSYFLVNERDDSSKVLNLSIGGQQFSSIKFLIGVDSTHNVSGVQTGALDPANAMFWTWNTGYIMAKLEGQSPLSTEPGTNVTYHIGGFRTGENTVREVSLSFPQTLVLSQTATSEIVIDADAMKWFDGEHPIKIAGNAYCATPGSLAVSIADNYATMFSVAQVINR